MRGFHPPHGAGSGAAGFRRYDEVRSVKPSCHWHDGSEGRRTRPAGGGCATLTRRAGTAGFGSGRLVESPTACGLRAGRRNVVSCGPGGVG
jgi:hypothetical protein